MKKKNTSYPQQVGAWLLVLSSTLSVLPSTTQAQTTVAGTTPGQFSVSESGAATYRIPIQVPPGVAGMQPKLELVYNSQSGNGLLGMGWSLSGLSAITRCPRTMASDGVRGGVNLDANDRFCLDGQRLIPVSGTYGAAGSEYRPERESFSKIMAYGAVGTGPQYFVVKTKAGLTMEYGNTEDSRALSQPGTLVRSWSLNKITDAKANTLIVSYLKSEDNSVQVPVSISYGGNAATGTPNHLSVAFEYDMARPDKSQGYVAGSLVQTDRRISAIKAYLAGGLVRGYYSSYAQNGAVGRSHLAQLSERSANQEALESISIGYQGIDVGSTYVDPIAAMAINGSPDNVVTGDFNGDGLTDVYFIWMSSGTNRLYLSRGDGQFTQYLDPIVAMAINGSPDNVVTGDFNGDGLTDVYFIWKSAGTNRLYLSRGDGQFTQYLDPIVAMAINGSPDNVVTGDFNGDGLTDVYFIWKSAGTNRLYLSRGDGQFTQYLDPIVAMAINGSPDNVVTGDFNGDGLTDVYFTWMISGTNRMFMPLVATSARAASISRELGSAINLAYTPLARGSSYTKDSAPNAAVYPKVDLQYPLYVVSRVEQSNGVGGVVTTEYKYGGLKAELGTGRGLLGFRWMSAKNLATGVESYTEYRQDYPYTGIPLKNETRLTGAGNGGVLKRSSTTVACQIPQTAAACTVAAGNRYFPHVTQSVEESWDLGGLPYPSITSSYVYGQNPQYGDPTQITVGTSDGASKTTVNEYWPVDTANWILGRLKKATVTSSKP